MLNVQELKEAILSAKGVDPSQIAKYPFIQISINGETGKLKQYDVETQETHLDIQELVFIPVLEYGQGKVLSIKNDIVKQVDRTTFGTGKLVNRKGIQYSEMKNIYATDILVYEKHIVSVDPINLRVFSLILKKSSLKAYIDFKKETKELVYKMNVVKARSKFGKTYYTAKFENASNVEVDSNALLNLVKETEKFKDFVEKYNNNLLSKNTDIEEITIEKADVEDLGDEDIDF